MPLVIYSLGGRHTHTHVADNSRNQALWPARAWFKKCDLDPFSNIWSHLWCNDKYKSIEHKHNLTKQSRNLARKIRAPYRY